MSITATFMALAVIFLRLWLQKAPKWISYALWGVVLFRLICPFSFSSAFSLLGGFGAPVAERGVISYIPENIVHSAAPQVNLNLSDTSKPMNSALLQGDERPVADPPEVPTVVATVIWLLGLSVMLVYSIVSSILLKRRLSDATLLEGNISETDRIISPFVFGLIKPRIYLPVGLARAERGYILLHERTHIRRRDYLIKPLAFLALSVHWFNPVIWLSYRLMCRDMEMSCDERVARELDPEGRAGYSATLLRFATGKPILAGSPLAFGESGAKDRVRHILNYKKSAFWLVGTAVIVCVAAAICLLANPAKTLEFPQATSILSMEMEQFNEYQSLGPVSITDSGDIETVLSALSGARKTLRQSVNDYPTRSNYLVIRLNLSGEHRTLCLYAEGNTYYVEEPYTGIYTSNRETSVAIYKIYNGAEDNYALAPAYAFEKLLYVNPATSYYPVEGTGQLYLYDPDSFTIINEGTGERLESCSLINWQAKEVNTGEWDRMFLNNATVDISGYQSRLEYDLGDKYRLYQMDGEVWLGHFSGDILLRLYQLQETDLSHSDIADHPGPSIPENETLRVDSPDGTYRAEAYGTDKGITAAGRYPYEGLRVIRKSDETTVWNGDGYYSTEFLWSGDSKYVAVYGEARTWGECFIVDAETGKVIELPEINTVSAQLDAESQPVNNRPDPIFKAVEWVNDTTICVDYRWIAGEGEKVVSGTYEYDIVSGNIMSNMSKISDSPG